MQYNNRLKEIKKTKEPILNKIVEWCQKHEKLVYELTRREVSEAVRCKM